MSQDWKHQHAESAARRQSPGKQCSQTHTLSAKTHCLKHTSKTKHKIKGWVHTHRAWSSLIRIWSIYSLYSFLSDESIWIELSWHLICTTGHMKMWATASFERHAVDCITGNHPKIQFCFVYKYTELDSWQTVVSHIQKTLLNNDMAWVSLN